MAKEVRLPQLGQTMEEGTIVDCKVNIGDEVKKGDCIFEIETDKATLEMESLADGFVKHILTEVGQTLLVGESLLVLGDKDEDVPQSFIDSLKAVAPTAAPVETPAETTAPTAAPEAEPKPQKPAGKVIASPRAKKLAKELAVDLSTISGTGPAGRITEDDVKNAASAKPIAPPAETEIKLGAAIPLNRLQKITAEKMLKSKREIPSFYLTVKADVTDIVGFRNQLNKTSDIKISYNDFIVKAVAIGLEKFPIMTGQLVNDAIQLSDTIDIGLAMSVPDGLVAPIIKNVDKKKPGRNRKRQRKPF